MRVLHAERTDAGASSAAYDLQAMVALLDDERPDTILMETTGLARGRWNRPTPVMKDILRSVGS